MSRISARRLASTCALSAALAAVAVPATASAKKAPAGTNKEKCSSELAIKGEGSSAQKVAQQTIWIPGFETSANKAACNGTQGGKAKPKVTYAPEGSGAGLKAFGMEGNPFEGNRVQYAGTDEAPNATQKAENEAHATGLTKPALATVPVLEFAVAPIVHLPSGCTATSAVAAGRLVIQNKTLAELWNGDIGTWGELIADETKEGPANKDSITGTGCLEAHITHIVRFDQSGTTHTFKKYLALINTEEVPYENAKKESVGSKSFDTSSEGKENTSWPVADDVVRPAAKGGGEEAKLVAETPSSVGYVNLAEARAQTFATAGPGSATFWMELQNSGTATEAEAGKKQKYADPSENGDVATVANSNCNKEKFTNGEGAKFPPKSVFETWNNVTSSTKEKEYPLCGLTYDLLVTPASAYTTAPAAGQATTALNYIEYVLNEEAGGGQAEVKGKDYFPIGSKLDKESLKGLTEVFETA